jgi:hypothetical protein
VSVRHPPAFLTGSGRGFSHDVYHVAELNEVLGIAGLPQVDLWS